LLQTSRPLTTRQVAAAREAAAAVGLRVEARSGQDGLGTLRSVATAVGALLALAIVAMTIGLIRSETVGDLRTLTATGAAARTRRALTASTAGALALLGVVLSVSGAYLALVAAYHAQLGKLSSPPVAHLLLLAIGLPTVAAGAGWLLAGREPRTFARQTLD
jgi:putative ABC transport system permease protein